MSYENLRYELTDGVLLLTLDRPEKLNAYNNAMHRELLEALDRADSDDVVRAIVLTGAGRGFCAGADLSSGGGTFDHRDRDPEHHRDGGGLLALRIFALTKPIIAAINGPAVGVGATMTLPMDIRLASRAARIGFVFTRRGVVPEACSSYFLPRVVGIGQASEWVLTGRVFDAEEAHRGGLVSRVLEPEQLLPTARELALEIAENTAPVSVALSRQMLWRGLGASHPIEAHRVESKGIYWRGQSTDAVEGIESFFEKRSPNFSQCVSTDMPSYYPWWKDPEF